MRLLFIPLAFTLAAPAPGQSYTIQDLGSFSNGAAADYSYAGRLNNWGEATGTSLAANQISEHAFFWSQGVLTDVHTLGGTYSWGFGINDAHRVVGYSFVNSLTLHSYLWKNGNIFDTDLSGTSFSRADAVNCFGDTAGVAQFPQGMVYPFIPFTVIDGVFRYLPTFGGSFGQAHDINDLCAVVGGARTTSGALHAFLWEAGVQTDLGTLGGSLSRAWALNNQRQIAGESALASGDVHAFLWEGGVMTDLGTLGGAASRARGIGERGIVVGSAEDAAGQSRAFIWEGGVMTDLNALIPPGSGWLLTGAKDVNELGQILGTGRLQGIQRAYLLTPATAGPRISGLVPGLARELNTVHAVGLTPGGTAWLVAGRQAGSTPVPGCPGLAAGIASPVVVGAAVADASGRALWQRQVRAPMAGRTVLLQVVDPGACAVSAPVSQTIR